MSERSRESDAPPRCSGCYDSFSGPWCDNCDQWPCDCVVTPDGAA